MTSTNIHQKALQLITDNFGETTSKMYEKFYQDKDDQTVLLSITELLTELLGANKAHEITKSMQVQNS